MPNTGWEGFIPRMTLGALGILFAALVGYFIWLGTTLIAVRQDVATIKITVGSLDESRQTEIEQRSRINSQRLNELEYGDKK